VADGARRAHRAGRQWRVERVRLLEWIRKLNDRERDEAVRSVRQALHQAERKNNRLRAELRRLGRPDPAAWTVPPEVFAARMIHSRAHRGRPGTGGGELCSRRPALRAPDRRGRSVLMARMDQEKISTEKESYPSSQPSKWRGMAWPCAAAATFLLISACAGDRIGMHQGRRSSKVAATPPSRTLDLEEADPVAMREKTEELQAARTEELHWQLRASLRQLAGLKEQ